jgi:hypothetical protein
MFFDNLFSDFDPFGSYTYRQPRRQDPLSYPDDNRTIILRKLFDDEYNYMCFDCHCETSSLDYFDVKNGIFLCYTCAQKHTQFPKEVSLVMTGNIRNLEEKDLLLLYYGGNKNLIEFIRRHYPLLENMQKKEMYCSKAMDYYRKLLRSKAFDEEEPEMPGKKKAYKSIFFNKINNQSPSRENQRQTRQEENNENMNEDENKENKENNEDNFNDIFSSTFFGDDLFGRNRRNQRKRNEESYRKTEPAVINKKQEEKDDANNEPTFKKINKTKINENHSHKKKQEIKKETKTQQTNINTNVNTQIKNTITINQIGELSRYPDAMEIDGMECE